ncbi:hypothetical protein [Streptomyces sp. NPDC096339]
MDHVLQCFAVLVTQGVHPSTAAAIEMSGVPRRPPTTFSMPSGRPDG